MFVVELLEVQLFFVGKTWKYPTKDLKKESSTSCGDTDAWKKHEIPPLKTIWDQSHNIKTFFHWWLPYPFETWYWDGRCGRMRSPGQEASSRRSGKRGAVGAAHCQRGQLSLNGDNSVVSRHILRSRILQESIWRMNLASIGADVLAGFLSKPRGWKNPLCPTNVLDFISRPRGKRSLKKLWQRSLMLGSSTNTGRHWNHLTRGLQWSVQAICSYQVSNGFNIFSQEAFRSMTHEVKGQLLGEFHHFDFEFRLRLWNQLT